MNKLRGILSFLTAACLAASLLSGCEFTDRIKEEFAEAPEEIAGDAGVPEAEVTNSISVGIIDYDTFNPLITGSETVKECMEFVYEPLFELDEKLQPVPVLAEGYTVSPDGRTIEIQLRHDVTWHDGSVFTSSDAAYTLKQIRAGITNYTENISNISDYMGIDNDKLRITLSYAVPDFVSYLTFPIVKYQSDMSVNPDFTPIGTGPFMYAGQPKTDELVFAAYDSYHGGRPQIDTLEAYMIPDLTKYESMFEASEIDLITGDTVDLSLYTPRGSAKNSEYVTNLMTFAGFNAKSAVLSGAKTRRGIASLIDKEAIVNSTIYSRGVAVDVPLNPSSIFYYDTNTKFRRDEARAMSLLGDDGWGLDEDGYYVRNTGREWQKLELELVTDSDSSEKTVIAEKIARDMTELGIPVSVTALPYEQYMERINAGAYDMMIGEIRLPPNLDLSPLISSAGNILSYANSDLDTLVAQMGMTQDTEQLMELYKQYGDTVLTEMPFAALFFRKGDVLSGAKLKTDIFPSISGHYRSIAQWSVR